jgi:putative transposase
MRRARWLAPWKDSAEKAVIYHCLSRVVDRRFVLGEEEKAQFRLLLRVQEQFTGCRVLAYCIMSNHFHILLEVPPMPRDGLHDAELLRRLGVIYSKAFVQQWPGTWRQRERWLILPPWFRRWRRFTNGSPTGCMI